MLTAAGVIAAGCGDDGVGVARGLMAEAMRGDAERGVG